MRNGKAMTINVIFWNWKYKWKERKNWRWIRFETEKIASPKKLFRTSFIAFFFQYILFLQYETMMNEYCFFSHSSNKSPFFLFKYRCNIWILFKKAHFFFFFFPFSFNIKFFFLQRDRTTMYVTSRIVKSKYRAKWKHRIIDNAWRKAYPIAKKVQQASASFKVKVYAWNSSYARRVLRSALLLRTLFRSLHQTDLQSARNIRDSWLANWTSYVRNTSVELSLPTRIILMFIYRWILCNATNR